MSRSQKKAGLVPAIALLLAGLIIGIGAVSPASAHFRKRIGHLRNHMKSTFFTKAESDAKYTFYCVDPTEAYAYAYVDESAVTSTYSADALGGFSCFGPITVKQIAEGQYRMTFQGFTDSTTDGSEVPLVLLTGVGTDVNASYQYQNEGGTGATIDVYLKNSAGTASSSDFTIMLKDWFGAGSGVVTTRAGLGPLANASDRG
jgi:hypothetical protein